MRKMRPGEAWLFVVPLAFAPLAMAVVRVKQRLTPRPAPTPTPHPTPRSPPLRSLQWVPTEEILPSRDGRVIYTVGRDNSLHLHAWDARTLKHLRSLGRFKVGSSSARLSPDGRTIFYPSGGWDGASSVLLDARTGAQKAQFRLPRGGFSWGGDISDGCLALASDRFIELRKASDGRLVRRLTYKKEAYCLWSPRFSPDGSLLAWTATQSAFDWDDQKYLNHASGHTIVLYSMKLNRVVFSRQLLGRRIWRMSVADTGRVAVVADYSRGTTTADTPTSALVFDTRGGQWIFKLEPGDERPSSLAFSPDGRWLAIKTLVSRNTMTLHDRVQIFDVAKKRLAAQWNSGYTNAIAFSVDSRTLYIEPPTLQFKLQADNKWFAPPPHDRNGPKYL